MNVPFEVRENFFINLPQNRENFLVHRAKNNPKAVVLTFDYEKNGARRYNVVAISPRARKNFDFHYYYTNKSERDQKAAEFLARHNEKKTRKSNFSNAGVKVGDIFVSSYGYDQTNVDAYQVVELVGSATVVLQEINTKSTEKNGYDGWSGKVIPEKDSFLKNSEPFRARANVSLGEPYVSLSSYSSANLWDGERSYYRSSYA